MIGTREELIRDKIFEQIRKGDFTNAELLLDFDDFIDNPEHGLVLFYNGDFYLEDDELASDLFRVNYSSKKFTDSESLISWLETQKYVGYYKERENVGLCDELRSEIRCIFAENKDILIEFR